MIRNRYRPTRCLQSSPHDGALPIPSRRRRDIRAACRCIDRKYRNHAQRVLNLCFEVTARSSSRYQSVALEYDLLKLHTCACTYSSEIKGSALFGPAAGRKRLRRRKQFERRVRRRVGQHDSRMTHALSWSEENSAASLPLQRHSKPWELPKRSSLNRIHPKTASTLSRRKKAERVQS